MASLHTKWYLACTIAWSGSSSAQRTDTAIFIRAALIHGYNGAARDIVPQYTFEFLFCKFLKRVTTVGTFRCYRLSTDAYKKRASKYKKLSTFHGKYFGALCHNKCTKRFGSWKRRSQLTLTMPRLRAKSFKKYLHEYICYITWESKNMAWHYHTAIYNVKWAQLSTCAAFGH